MKKLALILTLALCLTSFGGFAALAEEEPVELYYVDRYGARNSPFPRWKGLQCRRAYRRRGSPG